MEKNYQNFIYNLLFKTFKASVQQFNNPNDNGSKCLQIFKPKIPSAASPLTGQIRCSIHWFVQFKKKKFQHFLIYFISNRQTTASFIIEYFSFDGKEQVDDEREKMMR